MVAMEMMKVAIETTAMGAGMIVMAAVTKVMEVTGMASGIVVSGKAVKGIMMTVTIALTMRMASEMLTLVMAVMVMTEPAAINWMRIVVPETMAIEMTSGIQGWWL